MSAAKGKGKGKDPAAGSDPAAAPGENEGEYVACLSAKEIKKLARPEFAANPDKFYPTATLRKLGFSRACCPSCSNHFWRHTEKKVTCGDSQCEKKYSFIGVGTGRGRERPDKPARKITYAEAWEGFRKSLSTARVPCTPIPRYPVVARWRADVDYVAAGIFCFQPYCVTGELAPPANPLICPQFCLRFNDLDNIGLTGRHYSGFIMLGIQVFNKPNDRKFWMDECVEFNYRWLTEELEIDPDEITFIEDVWAGGGNLGPSIEYFVSGLELGNMVFMQYKTFPDGSREPLQVQVIDVGIGLERIPWLINGTPTSYVDVFASSLKFIQEKIQLDVQDQVWTKFGSLSCLLNVDEVDDLQQTWDYIGSQIGMTGDAVKQAVEPVKDMYTILDHTRCVLMAIEDGSLPSNVGGAANVRNILRRVFALLHNKGWWDSLGMDGLFELFEMHKKDLAEIYGPFKEYKSFRPIIELEYERWKTTDAAQADKLAKLMKKKGKDAQLSIDDWITCVSAWGIPADQVAKISGQPVPLNLYYTIASLQEKMVRATPAQLYATAHLPETNSLYYANHKQYEFEGKILEVIPNISEACKPNIVVLDQSAFYPTSGGQEHDTGAMWIDGAEYRVKDVMKVGPCVLHVLDPALPTSEDRALDSYSGMKVRGLVDEDRRNQLRNHHTATHIVYASSRKVLGPHIWQAGAKKQPHQAHLDITHFQSLTHADIMAIETEANRIVQQCKTIEKGFMPKDEAERQHGFQLYQGGVVPGNELRVVNIVDTDTEACCGTHADNTAEVGLIKIIKTARISDGIVRLYFVAGDNALQLLNHDSEILNGLTSSWGISPDDILPTAARFFDGYKRYAAIVQKQNQQILDLQMKCFLLDPNAKLAAFPSTEPNATMFIANMPAFAQRLKGSGKGAAFVGSSFIYVLLGSASLMPSLSDLESALHRIAVESAEEERKRAEKKAGPGGAKDTNGSNADGPSFTPASAAAASSPSSSKPKQLVRTKDTVTIASKDKKGKKVTTKVSGVVEAVVFTYEGAQDKVMEWFKQQGCTIEE